MADFILHLKLVANLVSGKVTLPETASHLSRDTNWSKQKSSQLCHYFLAQLSCFFTVRFIVFQPLALGANSSLVGILKGQSITSIFMFLELSLSTHHMKEHKKLPTKNGVRCSELG